MTSRRRALPAAPPGFWDRPEVREALASRNLGAVVRAFRRWTGASQTDVSVLVGIPQPHISELERGLRRVTALDLFERFADGLGIPRHLLGLAGTPPGAFDTLSKRSVESTPEIKTSDFVAWIADHSDLSFRGAYGEVVSRISRLQAEDHSEHLERTYLRNRITRERIVAALAAYYPPLSRAGLSFYQPVVEGRTVSSSILVRPGWLGANVELGTEAERFSYAPHSESIAVEPYLKGIALEAALDRLADVEAFQTVLTNNPIFRLLHIALEHDSLNATVTLADFASYALTVDLLERELIDALTGQISARMPAGVDVLRLPLRDTYLPTVAHALTFPERVCGGGLVTLLAAARPPGLGRQAPDYVLLVQERSSRVLNAVGKLAVVPKAFHEPTVEPRAEAPLSASLERELEEELLGREELSGDEYRGAAPLHYDRLSEPMQWLVQRRGTGAYRTECLGFGINMISGNYEFPCLVVIDDDEWWSRFAGQVEANWEILKIRLYSSRDPVGLQSLIWDQRWSNEGLFAFVEGLRRLAELDTSSRVAAPTINVEA